MSAADTSDREEMLRLNGRDGARPSMADSEQSLAATAVPIGGKPYRLRAPPFSLVGMRIPLTPCGRKEMLLFGGCFLPFVLSCFRDPIRRIPTEDILEGGEWMLGRVAAEAGE